MTLRESVEQISLSGGDAAVRRQKGCISLARRAVGLFFIGQSPVVKVLYKLAPLII